jgi:hypothetical protein
MVRWLWKRGMSVKWSLLSSFLTCASLIGCRWYPFLFDRAGSALHEEFAKDFDARRGFVRTERSRRRSAFPEHLGLEQQCVRRARYRFLKEEFALRS